MPSADDGRGPLRLAVDKAARAGARSRTPADVAALELARAYADAIDSSVMAGQHAAELLAQEGLDWSVGESKLLDRCVKVLDQQEALAQLGPKLLDALGRLLLTPAARSEGKGGKADDGDPAAAALRLLRGGKHGTSATR